MAEYLIITKDRRIPDDAKNFSYEVLTKEQFVAGANSDDGIEIEGGIFYNIDSLDQDIYNAIRGAMDIPIIYYQFSDQPNNLDFMVEEGIKTYDVAPRVVQPQSQPQPVQQPRPVQQVQQPVQQIPVQQPAPVQYTPVQQPQPVQPQPVQNPIPQQFRPQNPTPSRVGDLDVVSNPTAKYDPNKLNELDITNLLNEDWNLTPEEGGKTKKQPAKVILFGSSKGGTGKTFTCLLSAYRYAKTHPGERIALADFDIIDGQVGITISKASPTIFDFYKQYKVGNKDFMYLHNSVVKSEKFNPNLDFYLAPPMDIPEVTNNFDFWQTVLELLLTNYDTVFFDSGIDYLGKPPISRLYKIADKIILTSNTSINSVKSIVRQLQTLSGKRKNNVYVPDYHILDRVNLVLTRVSSDNATNDIVIGTLSKYAPIIAAFGNIDDQISKTQWYQQWNIWDYEDKVNRYLDKITSF